MATDFDIIQELVDHPGESLSVEIKRWIDPNSPIGIAKIIKAALAVRNYGGGYIVIGFNNDTFEPDDENIPENVKESFHIDIIQGLITKYASEPFEILVKYPERDNQLYAVIVIPSGIKSPVAAKANLLDNNNYLIRMDTVYIRSLNANNTPSTTKATWRDWPNIVEVCFDNREADIGRFFRRHLSGLDSDKLFSLITSYFKDNKPAPSTKELLTDFFKESHNRFILLISDRDEKLPEHGSWEVALIINGDISEHSSNRDFLNLLSASNPNYTGWPVWRDNSFNSDPRSRPFVFESIWETLIINLGTGLFNDIEYMRMDPKGRFYLRRALEDDITSSPRAPQPMIALDFGLPIIRTAEALAVGIAFAKAMGCPPEETILDFGFKWTKLKGRILTSWANPSRFLRTNPASYQDTVLANISIPLDISLSALGEFVYKVTAPLFEIFDGFSFQKETVNDFVRQLIERRLYGGA